LGGDLGADDREHFAEYREDPAGDVRTRLAMRYTHQERVG
jgi:hypothetical protein